MSPLEEMLETLRAKCGFEPAEVSNKGQVRILARVSNTDNWRIVMQRLKVGELDRAWAIDISQLYFLKAPSKKSPLVKGWRVILKSSDVDAACKDVASLVQSSPVARVTLEEVPLPGGGSHRLSDLNGRGAHFTGSGSKNPNLFVTNRGG